MSDSSYSGDEDEAPVATLESLFEGSDSDDDAARPAAAQQEDDGDQLTATQLAPAPSAVLYIIFRMALPRCESRFF